MAHIKTSGFVFSCGKFVKSVNWKAALILFLFITQPSLQCGPGRGGGRRRNRNFRPLVQDQYIPNVSEDTLGASGPPEGRIDRHSKTFKKLVRNINPNIIFKDEEGNGSDRLMSRRCSEKLDILAIMVMNHKDWKRKGIKLRVIEAWDDENKHTEVSLHYEGRAVDITTSDRDLARYGMLARLAVESGFDWVLYSKDRVHCSVKSDSSEALRFGGCFPATSIVYTRQFGHKSMLDLRVGEHVSTISTTGVPVYTEVVAFIHKIEDITAPFLKLITDSGEVISLTRKHHIYRYKTMTSRRDLLSNDSFSLHSGQLDSELTETVYAENIRVGDMLYVVQNNSVRPRRVAEVSWQTHQGIYAPLTQDGTIIVNGVLVSCYALIADLNIAHKTFAPYRALYSFSRQVFPVAVSDVISGRHSQDAIHWYARAAYSLGKVLLSDSLLPAG